MFRTGLGRATSDNQLVEGGSAIAPVDVDYVTKRTAVSLTSQGTGNTTNNSDTAVTGGSSLYISDTGSIMSTGTYPYLETETWETWLKIDTFNWSGTDFRTLFSTGGSYLVYIIGSSRLIRTSGSLGGFLFTTPIVAGQWYHMAITKSTTNGITTISGYLNGVLENSVTHTPSSGNSEPFTLGGWYTRHDDLNGWFQEFRHSNTVRYTGNFTPHTTPHANDDNTLLLIHGDAIEDDNIATTTETQYPLVDREKLSGSRTAVSLTNNGATAGDSDTAVTGGSSIDFDGSNNIGIECDSPNIPATGDFTAEMWFSSNDVSKRNSLITQYMWESSNNGRLLFVIGDSANIATFKYEGMTLSTPTLSNNTWYHIAATRSGNNFTLFLNGVNVATGTNTAAIQQRNTEIGSWGGTSSNTMDGNLQEIRISNTARYTGNFTPHTTPHVNDDNTLLLIHGDAISDDTTTTTVTNNTPVTTTAYGGVSIDNTDYKTGSGSLAFDGVDGYIDTGVDDFGDIGTIEMWFKGQTSGDKTIVCIRDYDTTPDGIFIRYQDNGSIATWMSSDATNWDLFSNASSGPWALGSWHHYAYTFDGNTHRIFVNGVLQHSKVDTLRMSQHPDTTWAFGVNKDLYREYFKGNLDNIRFSSVARYTSNFTPPTVEFDNDADTLLLINGDNSWADELGKTAEPEFVPRQSVELTNVATPTANNSAEPFSGAKSINIDRNDRITTNLSQIWDNYNTPWTVECWVRWDSFHSNFENILGLTGNNFQLFLGKSDNAAGTKISGRTKWGNVWNTSAESAAPAAQTNRWYHMSWSSDGTNIRFFIDGTQYGTPILASSGASNSYNGSNLVIGDDPNPQGRFDGKMSEIRISNTARYTADFTPHTTPHVDDANTLLLIHGDAIEDDNSYQINNPDYVDYSLGGPEYLANRQPTVLTNNGATAGDSDTGVVGGKSIDIVGTDSIQTDIANQFDINNPWTMEFWGYQYGNSTRWSVAIGRHPSPGENFVLGVRDNNYPFFWAYEADGTYKRLDALSTASNNTWHHWAAVHTGSGDVKLYFDGIQEASATYAGGLRPWNSAMHDIMIGNRIGGEDPWDGLMQEIRISNTARYTGNFTPHTTPHVNDDNTLLLIHGDEIADDYLVPNLNYNTGGWVVYNGDGTGN
jgi:hypothetical protein